jgi:hypothetical protein
MLMIPYYSIFQYSVVMCGHFSSLDWSRIASPLGDTMNYYEMIRYDPINRLISFIEMCWLQSIPGVMRCSSLFRSYLMLLYVVKL